jgi:3-deoxy-D-manno-octulosonic-acid transferase
METELWPNILHAANKYRIPVSVVNARLSNRSRSRYNKLPKVFNMLGGRVDQFLCQYPHDADNFLSLGVPQSAISVTGSIKFDIQIKQEDLDTAESLKNSIGRTRPVWIAASTHTGEEAYIFDAHKRILDTFPDALLFIIPRHPENFEPTFKKSAEYGFETVKRSVSPIPSVSTQVYVADSMGEMMALLGVGDVCFMGGSMLGDKVGGHNPLEPASLGLPILIGPSYYNFKTITQELEATQTLKVCNDSVDIAQNVVHLLSSPELKKSLGFKAKEFIKLNRGALNRTVELIFRNEKSK